jgi:hypothetical protein
MSSLRTSLPTTSLPNCVRQAIRVNEQAPLSDSDQIAAVRRAIDEAMNAGGPLPVSAGVLRNRLDDVFRECLGEMVRVRLNRMRPESQSEMPAFRTKAAALVDELCRTTSVAVVDPKTGRPSVLITQGRERQDTSFALVSRLPDDGVHCTAIGPVLPNLKFVEVKPEFNRWADVLVRTPTPHRSR